VQATFLKPLNTHNALFNVTVTLADLPPHCTAIAPMTQVLKAMWIHGSGIVVSAHETKSDLPIVAFSRWSALAKAAPVPDNPAKQKALHEAIGGRDRHHLSTGALL
jgi:hypothetical protein